MKATKKNIYLEINSLYRNRIDWPNPAEFEIPFSKQTFHDRKNSKDPISEYTSEKIWTTNNFESNDPGNSNVISMTIDQTSTRIAHTSDQHTVIVSATAGKLQKYSEYYTAAQATHPTATTDRNRIISYKYLGNDRAQLTFPIKFVNILTHTHVITVNDPTYIADPLNPRFFVPDGNLGSNSYPNHYLFNENLQQNRLITSYDATTKIITLDTSKSASGTISKGPITLWTITNSADVYSIRKKVPTQFELTQGSNFSCPESQRSFNLANTEQFSTDQLIGSFLERRFEKRIASSNSGTASIITDSSETFTINSLIGCTVRITSGSASGQIREIISNTNTTFTVSPDFTASVGSNTYEMICPNEAKRIIKYVNYSGTLPTGVTFTNSEIEFPSDASDKNDYYNNFYIVLTQSGTDNTRLIKKYTVEKDINNKVTSRKVIIDTSSTGAVFTFVPAAGDTFTITSGITESFSGSLEMENATTSRNHKVYILPFFRDNFNPLSPITNTIDNINPSEYEIELMSLTLPNKILHSGYGDSIRFYPYLLIELKNTTGTVGGHNIIISNNPYAHKSLFRTAIFDTCSPAQSSFIKIDGNHMIQTIKFKPHDTLKFSIMLPNGETLKFLTEDNFSPYFPNDSLQISALFSLRKLNIKNTRDNCKYTY